MTRISVVIGIYGDQAIWRPLAEQAMLSAMNQSVPPDEAFIVYENSLQDARNLGASKASGEWLCFLDADDTLDTDYFAAMRVALAENALLYPAVIYQGPNGEEVGPLLHWSDCLFDRNFMVIGTLVHKKIFDHVGGFRDFGMYEDWDLWIRCCLAGQVPTPVPSATYRATFRPDSRNSAPSQVRDEVYNSIRNSYTSEEIRYLSAIDSRPAGNLVPVQLTNEDFPWLQQKDNSNAIIARFA